MFLKNNNKGLSLVELIIGVAILGIISAPLLSMFVVASRTAAKSQDFGDATLAAENIVEQFESENFNDWISLNVDGVTEQYTAPTLSGITGNFYMSNILGSTGFIPFTEDAFSAPAGVMPVPELDEYEPMYIGYNNVTIDNSQFNVLVTLDPGTPSDPNDVDSESLGYYDINSTPLSNYTPTTNAFVQEYTTNDPDAYSWEAFINKARENGYNTTGWNPYDTINSSAPPSSNNRFKPQREVTILITESPANSGIIHATIKYSYEYTFPGTSLVYSTDIEAPGQYEFPLTPVEGIVWDKDELPTFYLLTFPWYYGGTSSEDVYIIDKNTDYEANVIIIKKNPLVFANPSSPTNAEYNQLSNLENNYNASVYFIQPYSFDLYDPSSNTIDIGGSLLTNLNRPLTSDYQNPGSVVPPQNIEYYIYNGSSTFYKPTLDTLDEIVVQESHKRIYDITVSLYDVTDSTFSGNVIYSINSSNEQ